MIVRKNAFVLRGLVGAFLGAAAVAGVVIATMGYAIFSTSEIATLVLTELAQVLDFIYLEGADDGLFEDIKAAIEEMAGVALVLFGLWYAVLLFVKGLIVHLFLTVAGWTTLWRYLGVAYLVGVLIAARPLLIDEAQFTMDAQRELLFTALVLDGPALAATLVVIWLWSYEKKADSA